jgi:hypothetical protein
MRKNNQLAAPLPEPTLAQRHHWASIDAENAVNMFTEAAGKLELAAETLDLIAQESEAIAEEHAQRAYAAVTEAEKNRERADKIRNFLA